MTISDMELNPDGPELTRSGDNFWQDKTVLVTGGAGFLGIHLVDRLHTLGALHVSVPRRREYDLRDVSDIQKLLESSRPDIVIHLAARVGGIGANQERPAEFFYDNLMMGALMLHESWKHGVEKFVAVGTVCAYPKHTSVPFNEDDLWDGYPEETNAPYGIAKKMLLVQSQTYRQQYGYNSIFLLPVNLYGPGDDFRKERSHVIPALIRKCLEAKEHQDDVITVWGDGTPTREFLYVEDAADAIALASQHYSKKEPVNIGSAFEISIRDLALQISKVCGFQGKIEWDPSKPNGQPRRKLDTRRAEREFGFVASTPFTEGLSRTVRWYQESR